MDEYLIFEAFQRGDYIPYSHIKKITNYIAGQLISWSPNRSCYEAQYNYATKLYHVCKWREEHGFAAIAKKGENICNNELVNFFKDEAHKNCVCSRA